MGRLLRLAISAFCVLSLLACLGSAWLWRQSYRTPSGDEYHASMFFARRHARYTVRSQPGRLTLFAPPPPPAKAASAAPQPGQPPLEEVAGQISDQHVQWQAARIWATDRESSFRPNVSPRPKSDTPVDTIITAIDREQGYFFSIRLRSSAEGRAARSALDAIRMRLLAVLEEPERALAAHVILARLSPAPFGRPWGSGIMDLLEPLPDGTFVQTVDGVRVLLRPERPFSPAGRGHDVEARLCSASLDPAQLATARDLWHRRLDLPVRSVPDWLIVAVTGIPPLAWFSRVFRRAWVRKHRQRRGLCRRCGYDLTGNVSGTCSECGQPIIGRTPPLDRRESR